MAAIECGSSEQPPMAAVLVSDLAALQKLISEHGTRGSPSPSPGGNTCVIAAYLAPDRVRQPLGLGVCVSQSLD